MEVNVKSHERTRMIDETDRGKLTRKSSAMAEPVEHNCKRIHELNLACREKCQYTENGNDNKLGSM